MRSFRCGAESAERGKKEIDEKMVLMKNNKKRIDADIKTKREALKLAKNSFKEIRAKKNKMDRPA